MKTLKIFSSLLFALLVLGLGQALAATDTENLTINATVANSAKLTLGLGAINFPDADPDLLNPIPANENPVSVRTKVKTTSSGNVTLTVLAAGDLSNGTDTITIDNVTWTATGLGFVDGTMDSSTAQSAGSWTGSGDYSGTFSYSLANSWAYAEGSYTASVTYTLTTP